MHYKNKPYKYLGLARHSENQEELVLYECRYENPSGKVWVRPKEMFFENVEVNGKTTARFKEIPLTIKSTTEITDNDVKNLSIIIEKAFGQWDAKWFHSRLKSYRKFYLATAFVEDKPVAFKLGYEVDSHEFYSWLGGVIPEYRGLGIAADLMKNQHEWCRQQAYKKVQTKTQNRFRDMLLLNIKHGFNVIGTHASDEGGMKIILEKTL